MAEVVLGALALAGMTLNVSSSVAVIGGLTLSGPIVLLFLPVLYRLLDPKGAL